MVIWTGKGIAALLFVAIGYGITASLINTGSNEDLEIAYSMLIASPLTFFVGRYWNRPRVILDPQTQQEVLFKPKHSVFWIPMQYWGIIFLIIGIIFLSGVAQG